MFHLGADYQFRKARYNNILNIKERNNPRALLYAAPGDNVT